MMAKPSADSNQEDHLTIPTNPAAPTVLTMVPERLLVKTGLRKTRARAKEKMVRVRAKERKAKTKAREKVKVTAAVEKEMEQNPQAKAKVTERVILKEEVAAAGEDVAGADIAKST